MAGSFNWTIGVILVAAFAAFIQERKLSFDLFGRRFDAYSNFLATSKARREAIGNLRKESDPIDIIPERFHEAFNSAQQLMNFLFPIEVKFKIIDIDNILHTLTMEQASFVTLMSTINCHADVAAFQERIQNLNQTYVKLVSELEYKIHPYLHQATATERIKESNMFRAFSSLRNLIKARG